MRILGLLQPTLLEQTTAKTPHLLPTFQQPPRFHAPSFILVSAFLLIGLLPSGGPALWATPIRVMGQTYDALR